MIIPRKIFFINLSEFNIVSRHRHASYSPESPCVRANYVLVSVRCNIGAPQAGTNRQSAYALTENTRCRRPGTNIRPTGRSERRQPRTGRTLLGSGTRPKRTRPGIPTDAKMRWTFWFVNSPTATPGEPRNTSPSRTAFSRVPATPCSVRRFTPTTSGNR